MTLGALTTRLVLVRHGEAQAFEDRVIAGPNGCRGLSANGRVQAAALRDRLRDTGELRPDVVLMSTLPRAIETATIVCDAFADGVERIADCDYCELHPGVCDGMPWDDYEAHYGPLGDPDRVLSPGGESSRTFDARVRTAMTTLIETYRGRSVLVFTHGGFIAAATYFLLGAPGLADREHRNFRLHPLNTSITEFSSTDPDEQWSFDRYNDVAHLGSLA